jgi:dTDP-glucose pyrophosphorylase
MRQSWVDFRPLMMAPRDRLHDAMQRMNAQEASIVLVCDRQGVLLGLVVDGDIRRALLANPDLNQPLESVMTRKPRTVTSDADEQALRTLAESALSPWMPMVDAEGRLCGLVDLVRLRMEHRHLPNAAVLMAGGKGTRLHPYTLDIPKPMVPVGGKPMLETIISRLSGQGFQRFYISVNHFADQIIDHFGDGTDFQVQISYLHEDKPLGTAGALRQLAGREEHPMVVMNGDVLTRLNLRALIDFHQAEKVAATMAVREYAYEVPFGVVEMADHRLKGLREKPVHRMFINAGIYSLSPQALEMIPQNQRYDMTQLLDQLKDHQQGVACFPVSEYWMDVGRVDDLERARDEFDSHF